MTIAKSPLVWPAILAAAMLALLAFSVAPAAVLGHRCDWAGRTLVAFHNLSGKAQKFELQLPPEDDFVGATDLLGTDGHTEVEGHSLPVKLSGYGYQWFRLQKRGQRVLP